MKPMQQLIAVGLMAFASIATAQKAAPVNVGDELPDNVRALLVQEMQAILTATQAIVEGIVKGQHELVAEKAEAIHNSFILKQKMTADDRKALMAAVPQSFVQRDRAFHQLSAELAEAARAADQPSERELFGKMMEACVGCHSSYASGRFTGLQAE